MLVIGQCNRKVIGTVNTSCLCKWTESVMCARCCLAFRRVNCFFFYEKLYMISSFFLKLMSQFLLTGNRTSSRPILSVIILVINKSDSRFAGLHSEQESTRSYYHYKYGLSLTNPFPLTLRLAPISASTTKMSLLLRYLSL